MNLAIDKQRHQKIKQYLRKYPENLSQDRRAKPGTLRKGAILELMHSLIDSLPIEEEA